MPAPVKKDNTITYTPPKKTDYQTKFRLAENFIVKAFVKEFKLDKIVRKNENGAWLTWPLSYKYGKKKIVIHHTAESFENIKSEQDEKNTIIQIYKYHTKSKKR